MRPIYATFGIAAIASLMQSGAAFAGAVCTATETFASTAAFSGSFSVCDNSVLNMTVTAKTTGWLGIGFSADPLMANTDMITGGINADQTTYLTDRFSTGYSAPSADAQQNVTLTSASESDGWTSLSFSRSLNTGDSVGDYNLLNGSYYLLWAYGSSDIFGFHGGRFGSSAKAYSFSSPVPVPNAAWVFLSGVLGWVGLGINRKNNAANG
ncbi:MAG: DOMON domain-containing protein [Methylomonas sp.]|nr:DOMON domain-containing protein [Methylomonas sp.]